MRRRSNCYLLFTGALLLLMALAFGHASMTRADNAPVLHRRAELVQRLGLTDLCLFTDARYCRHPSMADRNTAFQDHPMSFEHFPSGSLFMPPPHLKERADEVD